MMSGRGDKSHLFFLYFCIFYENYVQVVKDDCTNVI